jgi:hypothetical protein
MAKSNPISRRPTRRQLLSMAAVGAATAAVAEASVARAGSSSGVSPSEYDPLVGSWLVTYGLTSGGDLVSSKQWGVWTYRGDGTLVAWANNPLNPTHSTGHGHWRNLGNNKHQNSLIGVDVDPSATPNGFAKVDMDLALDPSGDLHNLLARIAFYDAGGNLTRESAGKGSAKRVDFTQRGEQVPKVLDLPQLS